MLLTARDKLFTPEELKHLEQEGVTTWLQFQNLREAQTELMLNMRNAGYRVGEPCQMCADIAKRLNIRMRGNQ